MSDQTNADPKQFTITKVFDAPSALVWRGGRYRYTMVDGDGTEYPTVGTYREVSPPDRLVFTWGSPGDADDVMPVITIELAEHGASGEQTRLTFHLEGLAGAPGDEYVYDGWSEALDLLATRVAEAVR